MQAQTRLPDSYKAFLDFVAEDLQRERHRANRRMLSVFLWCFLEPALVTGFVLISAKFGLLPKKARANADWLMLVFPVCYSVYILGAEVLTGLPAVFRRGGLANSLNQARVEGAWRERVCTAL